MENFNERASFRHVQCREYSRGLRHSYSPVICRTITWESEYTWSFRALSATAYCRASIKAAYSATLLSWFPIHLAMRTGPPASPLITTPMPDGPGFPRHPPSTYATSSVTLGFLDSLCCVICPVSPCFGTERVGTPISARCAMLTSPSRRLFG